MRTRMSERLHMELCSVIWMKERKFRDATAIVTVSSKRCLLDRRGSQTPWDARFSSSRPLKDDKGLKYM